MSDEQQEEWVLRCLCRRHSIFVPGGEPGYLVNIGGRDERGRIVDRDFPGCRYCGADNCLRIRGEEA